MSSTATHRHQATVGYLKEHSLVVVTAESCTAGLIAARLADVPGAGQVLECAFVVYDPRAKRRCLGVPARVIEQNNLTSEPVALAMARGALANSEARLAIANTGVADDSAPDVTPGTQCFAWAFRGEGEGKGGGEPTAFAETRVFEGDRHAIREAAADHALDRIPHWHAKYMQELPPG